MAYKRKAKKKEDLRKNPNVVDTSMGKKYLEMGRVVMLENRFYDNSEKTVMSMSMKNEVKIEDRDISIEYLRMALNMCQIGVNYQQAELIFAVVNKCDLLGGDLTVEDACDLLSAHKAKWDKYFNEDK